MRRLLVGRTCAALATALIPTTLTLALLRGHAAGSTGSAGDLGLVLACELLPMLVLLPVAGVLADRFPPQRVVLAADLLRGAAQTTIGAELLCGRVQVPDLAVLAAVTGAAVAFGTPAVRTLVAVTVDAGQRLRLNSRLDIATGLAQTAGPATAGGLMLMVGAGWSSLLTGALFIGSATTLGGLHTRQAARPADGGQPGFLARLREGWTETRRHRWFLANVLGHGVWHLTAGFLLTLGPLIAVRSMGGDGAWVLVAQLGTVGMLVGAFAASRLPMRRPLVGVAVGAAVFALPLTAFGLGLALPWAASAYFLAMFGLGVLSPLWETAIQRRIPQEVLGRVGSFDSLISFAARPLGLAVAVPVATVLGTSAPLLAGAVLVAAANLAALLLPEAWEQPEPATAGGDARREPLAAAARGQAEADSTAAGGR
ncbi:Major Facilitator Superfamily protein [Streptacidiphilus jiangxiensis]|uniref:Major Facilitator Superfamily protein n=2 Tax=Streptacidiphilus jiangxiensis TaxID=235985 RepID=A0A1H7NRL7_STRJI|nr:Major Facilitator Superfamily protein [Streptacidiphilus jiangxiensis]